MSQFIQLHILTPYAASNLNRDDTGRPKTLAFGNCERLRISSQSLKRAIRTSDTFVELLPDAIGKRSIDFMNGLVKSLIQKGLSEEEAQSRAEAVITNQNLGSINKKKKAQTQQLVHLSMEELEAINSLADSLSGKELPDLKKQTILTQKPKAVDIALFGRMLADASSYNVEAAAQVAHAFTTHRATPEDDFYTAVDDIKNEDSEADRGAGFMGVQEFGAGLFYLYICINASQLLKNLSNDTKLAQTALEAFITAATTVSPTGKQNAFASRSRAIYVLEEIGTETPRSLASAFMNEVGKESNGDVLSQSIKRLKELKDNFAKAYGDKTASFEMSVREEKTHTLAQLIEAAQAAIAKA